MLYLAFFRLFHFGAAAGAFEPLFKQTRHSLSVQKRPQFEAKKRHRAELLKKAHTLLIKGVEVPLL